jgi:DNA-binding CsgD family transcriptional regulator/tetratricopeptide (TPR) repeat protein
MGTGEDHPRIVGRAAELAVLLSALADARTGQPSIVVVSGPSGIGKSRLVEALANRAEDAGARVLAGDCLEVAGDPLPYGPLAAVLRDLVRITPPDRLAPIVGPAGADLARLVPELGAAAPAGDGPASSELAGAIPDAERDGRHAARLLEHVLGLIGRLAADRPTILVFEDVQWSDPATRDLLSFLAHSLRAERVLVVLTFRTEHLEPRDRAYAWLADLRRVPRVRTIELAPLTAAETARQLAGLVGDAVAEALAMRIHARSEGNPLFNEELLGAVRAGSGELPTQLSDALLATVARLPASTAAVLDVVAVAGRPVDEAFLAAVLGGDESEFVEPIRAAVAGQVLASGAATYRFRHGLFAEAITGAMTPGQRRAMHARIAAAIDAHPELAEPGASAAAESAGHWRAAGRLPEAFRRSVDAAAAATAVHALASADASWEAAVAVLDPVGAAMRAELLRSVDLEEHELLLRAAQAAGLAQRGDRAVALAERAVAAAESATPAVVQAAVRSELARILWGAGAFEAAQKAQQTAFEGVRGATPSADVARVMSRSAVMLLMRGQVEEAITIGREAASFAHRVNQPAVEAQALEALGNGLWLSGQVNEAVERFRDARSAAHDARAVEEELFAADSLAESLIDADRFDEAAAVAREGAAAARRLGLDRAYGAMFRGNGGLADFLVGRWAAADELTATGIDTGYGHVWALTVRARLLAATGRLEEARAILRQVTGLHGDDLPEVVRIEYALPEAEVLLAEGDTRGALDVVRSALAVDARHVALRLGLAAVGLNAAAGRAVDARARRDTPALEDAIAGAGDCLSEVAEGRAILATWEPPTPSKLATADLADAEAARMTGASDPERWAAVGAAFEATGMPYPTAYARYRQAEAMLQREGVRAVAAGDLLRAAHATCETLGAAPLASAIVRLARLARVALPTEPVVTSRAAERRAAGRAVGDLRLSARERQVLALVAAGRTNGQIAMELFISLKTASVHVTHILDKLGASNRVEAAMIATQSGLLDNG